MVALQGVWTMSSELEWRVAFLSVVFLTDVVVFIRLCREELGDWRAQRSARPSSSGFALARVPSGNGGVR
jgi:hypothetical protein